MREKYVLERRSKAEHGYNYVAVSSSSIFIQCIQSPFYDKYPRPIIYCFGHESNGMMLKTAVQANHTREQEERCLKLGKGEGGGGGDATSETNGSRIFIKIELRGRNWIIRDELTYCYCVLFFF